LRIGLAGAGKMAQHHARAIARMAGARLVAIADPAPGARDAALAAAPGAAGYDSLGRLLAESEVDVVHVCTPPAAHVAGALEAIAAGCHVYVEKPFAESSADADSLLARAAERGVKICAGHQLLYEAPARRAAAVAPMLGRLVHVESYFSFRTVRRAPGGRAPLRADLQLLDILPHPVYLLLHFLGGGGQEARPELMALELGAAGTVHALVRAGTTTGHLVVTLEGRPIESYVRLVGTNGSVYADFVRGTTQQLFGPGTSGIDKLVAPYSTAAQLLGGTTAALGARFLKRQRSYPGLAELFEAFYAAIRTDAPSPVSGESIRETVRICERVARALAAADAAPAPEIAAARPARREPSVVLTGGTGFLGRALARTLVGRGHATRVLARRAPAAWERVPGVAYEVADLGAGVPAAALQGADVLIHAAAETAGGWEEHQRNSIDATEHVMRAAAAAGIRRVIHVSSLAVVARARVIRDDTALAADSRAAGPYVWGKLESERLALGLGRELGVEVKVARPGAIVDYADFDPPGRLGKRVGPLFVAVGSGRDRLGVVELGFTAEALAWMAEHFEDAPAVVNLLAPELPTKRELVGRLRQANPGLRVAWLPTPVLYPLSWLATGLQKVLRPGRPAISLAGVFGVARYDTSGSREMAPHLDVAAGGQR
jgi:predicted dehydrogenase/nucleoside-diphosphate-sugar epimerase